MNWQSINPLALPSITIRRRSALPRSSAVYFLIERKSEIVYIGQAANLQSRWASHEYIKECKPTARIAWIEIEDRSMRKVAESSLISKYRPRLNRNHKPRELLPPPPRLSKSELKEWRESRNLTQAELSEFLKVNLNTISRWEVGMRKIPPYLGLALCDVDFDLKKGTQQQMTKQMEPGVDYNMPTHLDEINQEINAALAEIKQTLHQHTARLARIENVMTQLVGEYGDMRIRVRDLEASQPIGKETYKQ
jgi:DNA-binding transcriptional regulator YiaG